MFILICIYIYHVCVYISSLFTFYEGNPFSLNFIIYCHSVLAGPKVLIMSWWMHSLGSASGWPREQENNYESSIVRHFCVENQWLTFNFGGFLPFFSNTSHERTCYCTTMFWQYTSKSKHDTEVVSHQPATKRTLGCFLLDGHCYLLFLRLRDINGVIQSMSPGFFELMGGWF